MEVNMYSFKGNASRYKAIRTWQLAYCNTIVETGVKFILMLV